MIEETNIDAVSAGEIEDLAGVVEAPSIEEHTGQIVKLDRGFPLVRLEDGEFVRCKHATALVKGEKVRAVIGDIVDVLLPEGHDKAIIEGIHERSCSFVRKDPTERAVPQVLAANFSRVIVAQPLSEVNMRRLERELVLAHETGVEVTVILTKADLAEGEEQIASVLEQVQELAGPDVLVLVVSAHDPESVEAVRALIGAGQVAILIGRSGVGKSSLVNLLMGSEVQETSAVRESDGKGRHTTVSREMIELPNGGFIVDMPGVRGLGLWDADAGIEAAFADIEELAEECRFRDCKHVNEPGCAVVAALKEGEISQARYDSYCALKQETATIKERREQARWMQGEKASNNRGGKGGAKGSGTGGAKGKPERGKSGAKMKGISKARKEYNRNRPS